MRVVVTDDLAEAAAGHVAGRIRSAVAERGVAHIALSGGRTPWPMFERLAASGDLPWDRVHVHQVDERVAPPGHPDRNLTSLQTVLLDEVPAVSHPMPVDETDLEAAARRYGAELPEVFDLVHLGLGGDGHTASLVPGDPALEVTDRPVAVTEPYQGRRRMTLTHPAIDRAASILWLVTGDDKTAMLRRLLACDRTIPAGRVDQDHAVLITDLAV